MLEHPETAGDTAADEAEVVVEGIGVDAVAAPPANRGQIHGTQDRVRSACRVRTSRSKWEVGPGVWYVVASALAFSVMTSFVKIAGHRLPSQEVVAARGAVSLLLSWILVRRAGLSPWGTHRRLLLLRGFLGYLALSCVFHAVATMPLADATVLQYLYPLFTAILATAILGERPNARVVIAGAASLAGILLVARPSFLFGSDAAALNLVDVTIAVCGALLTAFAYVGVKHLTALEHPLVIVFYFPLVTFPATLPALLHSALMPTPAEALALVGVGIATQAGQVFLTQGLQHLSATRATALTYLQVVFATTWGAVFFGEIPDHRSMVGAMLVVSGAFLLGITRVRDQPRASGPFRAA
ncbi:MAG TPA: DMT family transporter [Candidatus Binatia bacterium]|jgi:drug/metabolite transporter (DMT)-like permease